MTTNSVFRGRCRRGVAGLLLVYPAFCCHPIEKSARSQDPSGPGISSSQNGIGSSEQLKLFSGSVTPCTRELVALGICDSEQDPLIQCITLEKSVQEPLRCKLAGKADFAEPYTAFTKEVTDFREIMLKDRQQILCFQFREDLTNAWRFDKFSFFRGHCQKETQKAVECDPTISPCTPFALDDRSCQIGWPCMKVEVKKSSFTPCTTELAAKGLCDADGDNYWGCVTYQNVGRSHLNCDVRLDLTFAGGDDPSIRREEKLYYNQSHVLCFGFPEKKAEFQKVKALSIVCQALDAPQKPAGICDLAVQSCKEETNRILLLTR